MMPTMPPDSHKISLKIIEAVKQHPVLYISEVKASTIKIQEFRQKVWKRISDELGLDPTWVRLRWKNLRDTYCRILKYKNKTEKGVRRKKWIFEDHLSFLKFPYESDYEPQILELSEEYIQDINAGGISSEGLLEQLEDRNDEDYSEYLEVLEETTADPVPETSVMIESLENGEEQLVFSNMDMVCDEYEEHDMDSYVQQIESKFRKIRPKQMKVDNSVSVELPQTYTILKSPLENSLSIVDSNGPIFITSPTLTTSLTTTPTKSVNFKEEENFEPLYIAPEGKTSIELFFDSMAQTVKRLPSKAQADIKMNICRIVTEAEVRYSKRKLLENAQKLTASPSTIPKLVLIPCSMIDDQVNE